MAKTNVQGWKINLEPYKTEVPSVHDDGTLIIKDGEAVIGERDFDVRETLAGLCFNKNLKLDPEGMFRANDIAKKIRAAGKSVILDEKEMEHINESYKTLKGMPERFIEFLMRIRDAEKVELAEVSKE